MSEVDISIVLNLHREGKYLARTLRSLKDAANYARSEGLVVEFVAVLDRPDTLTKNILSNFDTSSFFSSRVIEVDNGSPGPSRNDGASAATGEYLVFWDGDDLASFNYISSSYHAAVRNSKNTIIVPKWMFEFDNKHCIVEYFDLETTSPLAFFDIHPYVSKICVHRDLLSSLRFADVKVSPGYAYEDWHFNANAVALGYTFDVAHDAIVFYRVRSGSVLRLSDQLSVRQIPPSKLFEPATFLEICTAAELRRQDVAAPEPDGKGFFESAVCQHLIAAANLIDPMIEPERLRWGGEWTPALATSLSTGRAYLEICAGLVGHRFDHVFIFPNFGIGGAERYFLNIINALNSSRPDEPILVLMGEPHPDNAWLARLPSAVVVVDLAVYLTKVGVEGLDLLALKIIQHTAAGATVHLRDSSFGQSLIRRYGRALEDHRIIFYYFCEDRQVRGEFNFAQPWSFAFLLEYLDLLDIVVSDNITISRTDPERLGFGGEKWRMLPTLHNPPLPLNEAVARAEKGGQALLWASRMAWQKRPSLIRPIAVALEKLYPDLVIEVHGVRTEDFDPDSLSDLPNVIYKGSYSDFSTIAAGDYFAFLYTSLFDGIPTVLLEAAGMGLPVIAPDVPAINEFIFDGQSGLLLESIVDDNVMAKAYIEAIIRLKEEPELRRRVAAGAHKQVMLAHSSEPYTRALEIVLGRQQ